MRKWLVESLDTLVVAVRQGQYELISTLPISVGGLGVGHIAFAETLSSVGYKQGADIFTIFYILSSIFNIVGGIPFIYGLFRKNQ